MTKLMVATAIVVTTPTAVSAHQSWEDFKHTHTDPVNLNSPLEVRERLLEDLLFDLQLEDVRARWLKIDAAYDRRMASEERSSDGGPPPVAPAPPTSGWAIPAYIVECESGFDYTAENAVSTASGAYQMLDSTFQSLDASAGDSHAADAPPSVQDAAAAELYAEQGLSPWACA